MKCWIPSAFALLLLASGCGGGGGSSSGGFDSQGALLSVSFPDPNDGNLEPEDEAPTAASLVQQVVFTFNAQPDPEEVGTLTLPITDESGFPVPGSYRVAGSVVTFTPTLPLRPPMQVTETTWDGGGAGLAPGGTVIVRVSPSRYAFVARVDASLLARFADPIDAAGIEIRFKTTTVPERYFDGLPATSPALVEVDPQDGATGVSPNLFTDPDGLFPPRRTFFLTFDGPLHPAVTNVGDTLFQLVDLDDRPTGFPSGLPLGVDVRLVENTLERSMVEVAPSGVLPFGHLLALDSPTAPDGLGGDGVAGGGPLLAATFTTADTAAAEVDDLLVEDFDSTARKDADLDQLGNGIFPAEWDRNDANLLQAGFGFTGDGGLGRFVPPPPPSGEEKRLYLDTGTQVFPLFDGSTPDAPPGFVVKGGVFSFTDIDIPAGVVIEPLGPNPLVLTATGSIRLAGKIVIDGNLGTDENAWDSAVTSVPGGSGRAGGGRGGESHPIIYFPPSLVSVLSMVSPPTGGDGFSFMNQTRIGGRGGLSGLIDHKDSGGKYTTDQEITCTEGGSGGANNNGDFAAGAGGGSFFDHGKDGRNGIGNVLPDGSGGWKVRTDKESGFDVLAGGVWGDHPFFTDGSKKNDFIGPEGQVTELLGGQGGGGGGTRAESYYCGTWCKRDTDPNNDVNCKGGEFGGKFADSVGDARGGGGGAGGGLLLMQALGDLTIESTGSISSTGGRGGGGEITGTSSWGGPGGGGSGGAVLLQAGGVLHVVAGGVVNVTQGLSGSFNSVGAGGMGIIQLQVPAGGVPIVDAPSSSLKPPEAWADPTNAFNPAPFTPLSVALSRWYDLGRAIARGPPGTTPVFSFGGLDVLGRVQVDAVGNVLAPEATDVVCDYLGQLDPLTHQYRPGEEPREDFIPLSASIQVEFQGADALVEGSKEVDPASLTAWSASPALANGKQFLRWRVTFDIAARPQDEFTLLSRRPVVQRLQVHARY